MASFSTLTLERVSTLTLNQLATLTLAPVATFELFTDAVNVFNPTEQVALFKATQAIEVK